MAPTTKPEVWPADRPYVVYMVPADRLTEYAAIMLTMTRRVIEDLGWEPGSIETMGLISPSVQKGAEGILFLEDHGVDTRRVTLMVLWGETADSVNFTNVVSEECGIGVVVLPETGAMLPTVRMPALGNGWWSEEIHQEYAVSVYTDLIRDGRPELDGSEPTMFMAKTGTWN